MSTASVDTLAKAQGIEWLYALVLYGAIVVWCLLLASGDARVIPYGALLTMGFIGFWRYAWLMLHALRAVTYVRG
ncbi:MAG: hypothetical protein ACKO57_09180, partial [Alphaproteobacteria bacterium]